MIKDLVVNLTLETDHDPAAEFAVSIASAFEAHIAATAFAFDPVVTPAVLDGLSSTWVDVQREETALCRQGRDRALRGCGEPQCALL